MHEPPTHIVTLLLDAVGRGEAAARHRLFEAVYHELRRMAERQMAREAPGHTLQPTALVHEAYLRLFGASAEPLPHGRGSETHGPNPLPQGEEHCGTAVSAVDDTGGTPVPQGGPHFENRRHFFAAAAEAMRRILVEGARKKGRKKRGGAATPLGPPLPRGEDGGAAPVSEGKGDETTPFGPPLARGERAGRRVPLDECPDAEAACDYDADDLLALDEALGRLESQDGELAEVVRLRYFAGLNVEQTAELLGVATRTVEKRWSLARAWLRRALASE